MDECSKENNLLLFALFRSITTVRNIFTYVYILIRAKYTKQTNERTMSTPGRKRVQPILIEDDDDTDSNSTEVLVSSSSSSSNTNIQDLTPSLSVPTSELSSSSSDIKQPIRKNLYVALNFNELSHIRNVQSNSEFATLLYDFELYKNVVNGHICFSCRKVKFSFLRSGIRCGICLQRICFKCQRKLNYRHDKICFVSLNLLRRSSITTTPTSFTNDMTIRRNERTDSESSSSSSSTISKCTIFEKKKLSNNSLTCCIDCFILFDPSSLV